MTGIIEKIFAKDLSEQVNISFPGLGIGDFSVNRVAFTVPIGDGLQIRWYAIIITMGIVLAMLYCYMRSKHEGISVDDLLDMAIFTIPIAVIGARLYYVIFDDEHVYDSFMDVISIWEGGIAIFGAIIAGALTILCVCLIKKIKIFRAFDMVSPAVMLGQTIGRWGNFINGEAHGYAVEEGSFLSFIRMGLSYGENPITTFYHPTFLYESVWNLIGFVIINLLYKKKKFDGQVFFMYISWYGFGRTFIELLRTDSLGPSDDFRISSWLGAACFLVGITMLIINLIRAHRKSLVPDTYEPIYSKSIVSDSTEKVESIENTASAEAENEDEEDDGEDIPVEDISEKLKNLFNNEENENDK